jgi:hypothetical protein
MPALDGSLAGGWLVEVDDLAVIVAADEADFTDEEWDELWMALAKGFDDSGGETEARLADVRPKLFEGGVTVEAAKRDERHGWFLSLMSGCGEYAGEGCAGDALRCGKVHGKQVITHHAHSMLPVTLKPPLAEEKAEVDGVVLAGGDVEGGCWQVVDGDDEDEGAADGWRLSHEAT